MEQQLRSPVWVARSPDWSAAVAAGLAAGATLMVLELFWAASLGDVGPWAVSRKVAAIVLGPGVLQSSDVIRSAQVGLFIGVGVGAVAGAIVAYFFPITGPSPQWGIAALLAVVGGVLGAWSSSMIGISTPSVRLRRFEGAIEQGQILLMVDVGRMRVHEIEQLLRGSHPEAKPQGEEPGIPAFP